MAQLRATLMLVINGTGGGVRGVATRFPELFYFATIPVCLHLTERCHLRSTPLDQRCCHCWKHFGIPVVE
jgi:hypothetical protein